MNIHILGSAAGGGFPQWNCNCDNCAGLRSGSPSLRSRTQSSLLVRDDDSPKWLLINASPDILAQIRATPALSPVHGQRDSGIAAVLLMDAQIDHVTGLLMLRESASALNIYASAPVLTDLRQGLPLLNVLSHYCGTNETIIPTDGTPFQPSPLEHIECRAIALCSKAPPYSPNRQHPQPGDNIGLLLRDRRSGRTAFYAPGLGDMTPEVEAAIDSADVVLVDGSFWTEDEMIDQGLSAKRARSMGHVPQSGEGNMMDLLDCLAPVASGKRRILTHINNSNPILREDSAERAELTARGFEVAVDGMEITI